MLSNVDFKSVEELINAVDNSKIGYLQVNWKDVSITMRKEGESGPEETNFAPSKVVQCDSSEESNEMSSYEKERETAKEDTNIKAEIKSHEEVDEKNIKEITAPIVGTFYSSAGPDKDPFVSMGSSVKKGDTLCIVEAMKLMNEIQSDVDGEVVDILVENAQMVEYGQPMFKIKTL
ncbi:acetyl-CoA carboxylase biotin carboxyl carrier protein [Clostridium fermenticellae]|uniref:Biotin carboxyl carrier protein of acetyl-CoA carboxylase n=1 Tax=Clostridium fermenticellae TaxID=2068654 RepID=A0A386H6M9_9CLOT|nr:acetyl-CoA carboxylase biotin carboxyl carrier protein [Clostridium fermenticellae]AYD41326.1 acetyl-CoA carboxylase biotin carboxyl carrier protein [Clostridium fermenticellae]